MLHHDIFLFRLNYRFDHGYRNPELFTGIDEVWIREIVVFAQLAPAERILQVLLAQMPERVTLHNGD